MTAAKSGTAYMFGESPLIIEGKFFIAGPIHFWGAIADDLTKDVPDLGGFEKDYHSFVNIGLFAASLLSGLQLGLDVGGLYPVYTIPSADGATEIHAGAEISNGFSLPPGTLHLSFRATTRLAFTGTNDEGNRTSLYFQPYLGYLILTNDLPGMMKRAWIEKGDPMYTGDDIKPAAGYYFDIGFRFGFPTGKKGSSFLDIEFPQPMGGDAVPHIKIAYGFQMFSSNL